MAALREGPVYDVTVEPSTLVVDGLEVAAVHARPDGLPRPGLVLHPDIGGLLPLIYDLAPRVGDAGRRYRGVARGVERAARLRDRGGRRRRARIHPRPRP